MGDIKKGVLRGPISARSVARMARVTRVTRVDMVDRVIGDLCLPV